MLKKCRSFLHVVALDVATVAKRSIKCSQKVMNGEEYSSCETSILHQTSYWVLEVGNWQPCRKEKRVLVL